MTGSTLYQEQNHSDLRSSCSGKPQSNPASSQRRSSRRGRLSKSSRQTSPSSSRRGSLGESSRQTNPSSSHRSSDYRRRNSLGKSSRRDSTGISQSNHSLGKSSRRDSTGISKSDHSIGKSSKRDSISKSNRRGSLSKQSSRRGGLSKSHGQSSSLSFHAYDFIPKHSTRRPFREDYKLGKLLGEGGFGVAYQCTHIASGVERAVKILINRDERAWIEARQEFRTMAKLDHPNIAKPLEVYEDDDCLYIVQDLYRGGDLFDLVKKGTLTEYQTAMVVNSLLASIGYCHKRNLCHRDLKPENVLLDDHDELSSARIIDFGLSRYAHQADKKFSDAVGSLEYVSPQVLKGSYGKQSDIWSVGVIAYVLLAGRTPFEGANDREIMAAIKEGHLEFKGSTWDSISEECQDFVQFLLTYEEEDRPTADKALQHRWLQRMRKQHQKDHHTQLQTDIQSAVDALERFTSRRSKLKQATCVLLAAQFLRKSDRDRIDPVFRVLDRRADGCLNAEDLQYAFWFTDITGDARTDEQIDRIVKEVNFSKSGSITYSEFAAVMMLEMGMVDKQRLGDVFDHFVSRDCKDEIDWRDLERVLFPRSDKHEQDCRRIVAEATNDHSKVITFRDFKRIMLGPHKDDSSRRHQHDDLPCTAPETRSYTRSGSRNSVISAAG